MPEQEQRLGRPRIVVALLGALAVAVTSGSALVADQAPPPPASTTITRADVIACPVLAGTATLWATAPRDTLTLRTADKATTVDVPLKLTAPTTVFALLPVNGQPAGAISAEAGTAVSWGSCAQAQSRQTLVLADSRGTDILLVNADATDAVVNVTLRGPDGLVKAGGTRGLKVPSLGSLAVPLSVLTPAGEPVSAEIEATVGRVRAFGRLAGTTGIDVAGSAPADTQHTLGAVPAGATGVTLLVSNPGQRRATLTVTALGGSGRFTPAGAERVTVAPGVTTKVDLSGAASETEPIAVHVTSDEPVAASLSIAKSADVANLASQELLENGQVLVPGGRLVLANPTDEDATVTLAADAIAGAGVPEAVQVVKAGHVWSVALPTRAATVTITSVVPLGAWVVLPSGAATAPLQAVRETSTAITLERDPRLR